MLWPIIQLIFIVPFLIVFTILGFFFGPAIALFLIVMYGLYYYATLPTPNDLKVGAVPYVALGAYSGKLIDNGLIGHGRVTIVGYDKIQLRLTNNSPVTLFSVELHCQVDELEFQRAPTSFDAAWTGKIAPGTATEAIGFIREVHTDPQYMDPSTLKCRPTKVTYDRPKAMLALGSDNVQTLVEARYDVKIRDLDPGDNTSSAQNQITVAGAVSNGSTLPLYGVTFECYLDGKRLDKFSAKFDSPVPPNSRRAFQVSAHRSSYGYMARGRIQNASCAVYSYDFGES